MKKSQVNCIWGGGQLSKKIIPIVIVLLVFTLTITYAYFTAQNDIGELEDNVLEQQTANLNGTEVTLAGETLKAAGTNVYPGHKEIVKLTVSALHDNGPVNYNLEWVGKNTLTSEVTYKIYKSETEDLTPKITCNTVSIPDQDEIHYYEECSISEFGTLESNGIYQEGIIEQADIETTQTLLYYEEITGNEDPKEVYYYVVIEYPNDPDNPQDGDAENSYNGSFKLNIGSKDPLKPIIAQAKTDKPDFSNTSCLAGTNNATHSGENCEEETNGIYEETTELGKTYYYRGTVNNNWVKFGKINKTEEKWGFRKAVYDYNYYESEDECSQEHETGCELIYSAHEGDDIWWRIIRINEDGTVRLIYAGEGSNAPASTDQVGGQGGYWINGSSGIGRTSFNPNGSNAYVGYMYGTPGSSSFEKEHGYDLIDGGEVDQLQSSDIKKAIDEWYKNNLLDEGNVLSGNTGFCGDRSLGTGYEKRGYGDQGTNYKAKDRMKNYSPSFVCPDSAHDLYTIKTEKGNGNGALDYPIGLITADEILYAGGGTGNFGYWLKTAGYSYWTLSPYGHSGSTYVYDDRFRGNTIMNKYALDIRPVVNVLLDYFDTEGKSGTIENPYIVTSNNS